MENETEIKFEDENEGRKSNTVDMLHGSLLKKILAFAIPIAISSILQQLFNSVDVAVVGRFANSVAQAAVGCNSSLINLILNIFLGLSVGANVIIAAFIGRREKENANRAVHTSMLVAIISGVILLVITIAVARPVLKLMNTPDEVLPYAIQYLSIYAIGMPFIMIYNFGAAILRCIGDTKRPLISLIVSGAINAGLNMFLVIVFHLDTAGVAIATVISNVISAGMVWYWLTKETSEVRFEPKRMRIYGPDIKQIMRIGIPAGVQGMIFALTNVIIQSVMNGYGTEVVAGSAIALNFEVISYFVIVAFNQAAVTFTSQNYAAGLFERCKKVFRVCLALSMIFIFAVSIFFVLLRVPITGLFTKDPVVASYAMTKMIICLTVNFIACTYEVAGSALRGMGYSMTPALLMVLGICVFRITWAFTVCRVYTAFEVLLVVYPLSWIITGIAVLIAYFLITRKALAEPREA